MGQNHPTPHPTPQPPQAPPTPAPTIPTACGDRDDSQPQLAVQIALLEGAQTGSDVMAAVLSGSSEKRAKWSDWKLLAHDGCTNLQYGDTDFFNEFNDCDDPWLAVAFYNCGSDAVAIEGIEFWNGDGPSVIKNWCSNVVGFGNPECFNEPVSDVGECFSNKADSPIYDAVWLNADYCKSMSFSTQQQSTDGTNVASIYYKSDPGVPVCPTVKQDFDFFVNFGDTLTTNMDYNIIGLLAGILLLFYVIYKCVIKKGSSEKSISIKPTDHYQPLRYS